jgi:hypothetical protein
MEQSITPSAQIDASAQSGLQGQSIRVDLTAQLIVAEV